MRPGSPGKRGGGAASPAESAARQPLSSAFAQTPPLLSHSPLETLDILFYPGIHISYTVQGRGACGLRPRPRGSHHAADTASSGRVRRGPTAPVRVWTPPALGLRPCHGCTGTSAGFSFVASVTRSSAVWLWASIWRQRRVRMNFLRILGSPRGAVQPRTPPGARQAAVRSGSVADALPSDLLPRHTLHRQAALSSHGPGQIRYRSTS